MLKKPKFNIGSVIRLQNTIHKDTVVKSSYSPIFPRICDSGRDEGISKENGNSQQEVLCENTYGCTYLNTWKKHSIDMCSSREDESITQEARPKLTSLTCYKYNHKMMAEGTFPHTVCEASNLVMNFKRLSQALCLKYRPGYFCKGKFTYYQYVYGALSGNCDIHSKNMTLDNFSKDFGKDIFSSFKTMKEAGLSEKSIAQYADGITIFVSRELDEHVNLFHSMTDFFATHLMIEMFGLDLSKVQIVLLDNHYDGPFDFLWNTTYSLYRPMRKASEFDKKVVRFEKSIFQHSGYATQLMSNLLRFNKYHSFLCHSKVKMITSFSDRILHGLKIPKRIVQKNDMIRVIFISRKPYERNGIDHSFMGRQIRNEDEIMERLSYHPLHNKKFIVEKIDFAQFSLIDQIKKVQSSDFLIGYHGAALTHALWLPEDTSAVMEIWKSVLSDNWKCFEQITYWKGNLYEIWTNKDANKWRADKSGDYLTVQVDELIASFSQLLDQLIDKRNTLFQQ